MSNKINDLVYELKKCSETQEQLDVSMAAIGKELTHHKKRYRAILDRVAHELQRIGGTDKEVLIKVDGDSYVLRLAPGVPNGDKVSIAVIDINLCEEK